MSMTDIKMKIVVTETVVALVGVAVIMMMNLTLIYTMDKLIRHYCLVK